MPHMGKGKGYAWRDISALRIPMLLLVPACILFLSQYITIQSLWGTLCWFGGHLAAAAGGWGLLLLILLVLYAASGSLFWSSILLTVPCVVLPFVSYYENLVNGVPFRISDFFMVGAAGMPDWFFGRTETHDSWDNRCAGHNTPADCPLQNQQRSGASQAGEPGRPWGGGIIGNRFCHPAPDSDDSPVGTGGDSGRGL